MVTTWTSTAHAWAEAFRLHCFLSGLSGYGLGTAFLPALGLGPEPQDALVPGEPMNAAASSEAGLLSDSLPGSLC